MKKFFKEFKAFITRGNVLDMAVGIIIGGAFTAIITAIVSNVLTPLLSMIPGNGDTGALQVVLRAVYDSEGVLDVSKSAILDFGAVISAVVTFLITAFVLFVIVKTINNVRAGGKKLRDGYKTYDKAEYKQLRKEMKAQGCGRKEINAAILAKEKEKLDAAKAEEARKQAEAQAAALANAPETLLKEIRDLLAKNLRSASSDTPPAGEE